MNPKFHHYFHNTHVMCPQMAMGSTSQTVTEDSKQTMQYP